MSFANVPFIDEHTRAVNAPAGEVWRAAEDLMCAPPGAFPGAAGRRYRGLIIDSRAHVLVVRRMLARIARRAERTGAGAGADAGGLATPA